MTHGADPTSKLSVPPDRDTEYFAHCAHLNSSARVIARTWYAAREEACRLLGCGLDQVTLKPIPPLFLDLATGEITEADGDGRVWIHPAEVKDFDGYAPSVAIARYQARKKVTVRSPLRKSRKVKGAVRV